MRTAREKSVMILIDARGKEISSRQIANEIGFNIKTVTYAMGCLIKEGLVEARTRPGRAGLYRWIGDKASQDAIKWAEASRKPKAPRYTAKADLSSGGTISTTADTEAEARRMVADIAESIEAHFAKRRAGLSGSNWTAWGGSGVRWLA